jgi:hypothetical protein
MNYEVKVLHDSNLLGSFVEELKSDNPEAIMILAQDGVNALIEAAVVGGSDIDLNLIAVEIEEIE